MPTTTCDATRVTSTWTLVVARSASNSSKPRVDTTPNSAGTDADRDVGAKPGRLLARLALDADDRAEDDGDDEAEHGLVGEPHQSLQPRRARVVVVGSTGRRRLPDSMVGADDDRAVLRRNRTPSTPGMPVAVATIWAKARTCSWPCTLSTPVPGAPRSGSRRPAAPAVAVEQLVPAGIALRQRADSRLVRAGLQGVERRLDVSSTRPERSNGSSRLSPLTNQTTIASSSPVAGSLVVRRGSGRAGRRRRRSTRGSSSSGRPQPATSTSTTAIAARTTMPAARLTPAPRAARRRSGRLRAPSARSSTHTRPPCSRTCSATRASPRPTPSPVPRRPAPPPAGEPVEDDLAAPRRHARTRVLDGDLHGVVDLAEADRGGAVAVLRGVVEQVGDDTREAPLVGPHDVTPASSASSSIGTSRWPDAPTACSTNSARRISSRSSRTAPAS